MVFPTDPLGVTFELALGADLTAAPSTWAWTDITEFCRPAVNIKVGRSDEQGSSSPASMTVTVDNADGRFTRRNPTGAWFGQLQRGTPIRVRATDGVIPVSTRFTGFIAELPPRWSTGFHDRWVPIVANGVFRRLEQQEVNESALKRFVLAESNLRAYWPIEDARDTGQYAASAVSGQENLWVETDQGGGEATGADWAAHSDLPGSEPVAGFEATARLNGWVNSASSFDWSVMFFAKGELIEGQVDGTWTSARIMPTGTDLEYRIEATDASVTCTVIDRDTDATVVTLDSADELGSLNLLGEWHSIALLIDDIPGDIVGVSLFVDGRSGDSVNLSSRNAGRMDKLIIPNVFDTADIEGMGIGHVAVFDDVAFGRPSDFHTAGLGHTGETAGDRIRRLAEEESLAFTVTEGDAIGGVPASSRMGAQSTGTVASLLREAETADGGFLYETGGAGVGYVARSGLYDATAIGSSPAVALDRALRHIGDVFEPSDDDQFLTNDVTVSRTGGSSARTREVPAGEFAYPTSASLNVAADGALIHQASWRVHLGTEDEYRFPFIELNLATNPDLVDEWVAARVGSRITIDNPPPGMPPDQLDLVIVGYTELLDNFAWRVRLHCAPARPYEVAQFPGELTVVKEDFEDASLNVTVTDGGDAAWSRTTADAHRGDWSFRSGSITHSQTSDAIVTVPAGTTRCRFWYRTSSEAGNDLFRVIVGGSTELEASGQSAWTLSDYIDVTGAASVTFRYLKNAATTRFNDRVHIDDLQFEGGANSDENADRARLDTSGSELTQGLLLPGSSGSYASTPDDASLDIIGDLELRAAFTARTWPPAADSTLVAKYADSTDNRSYRMDGLADGTLRLVWSTDGTNFVLAVSTVVAAQPSDGEWAVRATLDVDNGVSGHTVTFYTSDSIDGPWTQLGDPVTTAGITSIFSGTADLEVGARDGGGTAPFDGVFHAAQVRDGIGSTIVARPDFDAQAAGTTSFSDSVGRSWTVNGDAQILGAVTDTATTMHVTTTAGPVWVTDPNGLDVDGVAGDYASTPDAAVLDITADIDLRADVTPVSWDNGANQDFIAKWDDQPPGNGSYFLGLSSGRIRLVWSEDGSTVVSSTSTVDVGAADGTRLAVRATLDVDDGAGNHVATFYTAPTIDGPWTILGTAVTTAGTTSIFSGTAPVEVGTLSEGQVARTDAVFHAAEVRSGIDGTLVAAPDFRAVAPGTASFTDSTGLVWTIHGDASLIGDFPIDLAIGGEIVRATAIAETTSPQQFTVTRSINGVTKTHSAGAGISLASPMILALGD